MAVVRTMEVAFVVLVTLDGLGVDIKAAGFQ